MPKVSVLYIQDKVFSKYLKLIRYIGNPKSRSIPHVTVRYFDKIDKMIDEHRKVTIEHLKLVKPGMFQQEISIDKTNYVVYILCESEILDNLEYKPEYPASKFHITLYEGSDKNYADELILIVNQISWNFEITLPPKTNLEILEIGTNIIKSKYKDYDPEVKRLYKQIVLNEMNEDEIENLSLDDKKEIIENICKCMIQEVVSLELMYTPSEWSSTNISESDLKNVHFEEQDGDYLHSHSYTTPPELASSITEYALSYFGRDDMIDFGDPAIGNGAFFQALMKEKGFHTVNTAIGFEINREVAEKANRKWGNKGLEVRVNDFLKIEYSDDRNLILANPPYLRHQEIPSILKKEWKSRIQKELNISVDTRSGQYVYFILMCHLWMADEGVAVWIIPSEFMQSDYGRVLRQYFTEKVQLERIHKFHSNDPQFENVYALPTVVAFKKVIPSDNTLVEYTIGGDLLDPRESYKISIEKLKLAQTWKNIDIFPREIVENPLFISDFFTIKRGIATGANEFFIMDKETATHYNIPKVFLKPILPKSRTITSDIIESDKSGEPILDNKMYMFDCSMTEELLLEKYPDLKDYIEYAYQKNYKSRTLLKNRLIWYKQEEREIPLFLCTYMGRGTKITEPIRVFLNYSSALATNTYLLMYPNKLLKDYLSTHPGKVLELHKCLKMTAKEGVVDNARMYAGGLVKVEPKDLLKAQLSSPPKWLVELSNTSTQLQLPI